MSRRPLPCAVVTCGPGHSPLDAVRRLTNFSTGELGARLAEALTARGWDVWCFRGEGASFPAPRGSHVVSFGTNASLEAALRALRIRRKVLAFFHAAALCDFEAQDVGLGKRASDAEWILHLRPAPKLLPGLRALFPRARIVGWKYEVEGGKLRALRRARAQIQNGWVDASVANGPACGNRFYFLRPGLRALPFSGKARLCEFLAEWAGRNALPEPSVDH